MRRDEEGYKGIQGYRRYRGIQRDTEGYKGIQKGYNTVHLKYAANVDNCILLSMFRYNLHRGGACDAQSPLPGCATLP